MENGTPIKEGKNEIDLEKELPFISRDGDWGGWVYEHRRGICISVLVYAFLIILLASVKITLHERSAVNGIIIDLERTLAEMEALIEKERELREMTSQQFDRDFFSDVRNVASNDDGSLNAALRDDRGTQASQIYDEANAMMERLSSSRAIQEAGLREVQNILDSRPGDNPDTNTGERAKIEGNVTVRYSLDGRNDIDLPVPAYQCQGGGEITVNILVNRSGTVLSTSIARGSSTDPCLTDMATKAAAASRFNASPDAPERQQGTITYIFVPQ